MCQKEKAKIRRDESDYFLMFGVYVYSVGSSDSNQTNENNSRSSSSAKALSITAANSEYSSLFIHRGDLVK